MVITQEVIGVAERHEGEDGYEGDVGLPPVILFFVWGTAGEDPETGEENEGSGDCEDFVETRVSECQL